MDIAERVVMGIGLGTLAFDIWREVTVPYTGVPLNIIVACTIGALCSFGYGEPVKSRGKMLGGVLTSVFMGAAATAILNTCLEAFFGLKMLDGASAGVGAVAAFVMRPLLPWAYEMVRTGNWIKLVPFFGKKE